MNRTLKTRTHRLERDGRKANAPFRFRPARD
jgi:hypothetical protein